jgi:hypothetical protein
MSVPIPLRGDFKAYQLRRLAKKTKDGPQAPKRRHSTIGYVSPMEFERQAGLA